MQSADDGLQKGAPGARATADPAAFRSAWPALITGGLALALYARTLAPGLTWAHNGADGGDLLAAALTHGVPHPSGYPAYQLLLASALKLAPGEPARIGNWLSAISAALAVALLTDLARRTLAEQRWRNIAALAAGLIFATSPGLWSQAVITEVYAPNALAAVLLAVADVALARGRGRRSAGMALADGRGPRAWPGPGQSPDPGAHVAGVDRLDVAAAANSPSPGIVADACSAPGGPRAGPGDVRLPALGSQPRSAGQLGRPKHPGGFRVAGIRRDLSRIWSSACRWSICPADWLPGRVRPAGNSAAGRGAR